MICAGAKVRARAGALLGCTAVRSMARGTAKGQPNQFMRPAIQPPGKTKPRHGPALIRGHSRRHAAEYRAAGWLRLDQCSFRIKRQPNNRRKESRGRTAPASGRETATREDDADRTGL